MTFSEIELPLRARRGSLRGLAARFGNRVQATAWDVAIRPSENLVPKLAPDSTALSRSAWT